MVSVGCKYMPIFVAELVLRRIISCITELQLPPAEDSLTVQQLRVGLDSHGVQAAVTQSKQEGDFMYK